MRRAQGFALAALVLGCLAGCGGSRGSFAAGANAVWSTIPVRKDFAYEQAWDALFERLVTDFEPWFVSRADGYFRSDWTHTWSGRYQADYRVRLSVKFAPDRKQLRLRCEAQKWEPKQKIWVPGTDPELLRTIKTDVMGIVGTTTR